jgi:hypothetical protein
MRVTTRLFAGESEEIRALGDAFCYFDETSALHPLHAELAQVHAEQETFPWNQ